MKLGNSYVYFTLTGDDFDPQTITDKTDIYTGGYLSGGYIQTLAARLKNNIA